MVRVQIRLPGFFCMGKTSARAKVRAQPQQYKKSYNSAYKVDDDVAGSSNNSIEMNYKAGIIKPDESSESENKVMVVVDPSPEAKNALEWALSHTVRSQDILSLLIVTKQGGNYGKNKVSELLGCMKKMCEKRLPGVQVEATFLEEKEKGRKIVEEAKKQKVSLLVLGQRKRTMLSRLQSICTGRRKKTTKRVAEYCIRNANCMTIAVRRKSRKCGGYLITTKQLKNFWLLA